MRLKITTAEFIQRSKIIHVGKYKYWFVIVDGIYNKVLIYCVECCEFFWQKPSIHLAGCGCPMCKSINTGNRCRSNTDEFKAKAKLVHGDDCNYDLSEYFGAHKKIEIQCNKCNRIFSQTPDAHLHGNGCPDCAIDNMKGINNHNYNSKLTDYERQHQRCIYGITSWKNAIKKRDDMTCQKCGYHGQKKDGIMIAHHLNNFSQFKEQRLDPNNGVCLCNICHKTIHKHYGNFTTAEHYKQFITEPLL